MEYSSFNVIAYKLSAPLPHQVNHDGVAGGNRGQMDQITKDGGEDSAHDECWSQGKAEPENDEGCACYELTIN